jgi:hypothetical protein
MDKKTEKREETMINWLEIATIAVTILTFFAIKISGGVGEKIGEEIYDFLKKKLKGDEKASNVLSDFCQNPKRYKAALIDIINDKAEIDQEFGNELSRIVDKGRNLLKTGDITQIAMGNGNAIASDYSKASVKIEKIDKVPSWIRKKKK